MTFLCVSPFSIYTIIDWTISVFTLNQSVLAEQQSFKWVLNGLLCGTSLHSFLELNICPQLCSPQRRSCAAFKLNLCHFAKKCTKQIHLHLVDENQYDWPDTDCQKCTENQRSWCYTSETSWDKVPVWWNTMKRFSTSNQSRVSPDGID